MWNRQRQEQIAERGQPLPLTAATAHRLLVCQHSKGAAAHTKELLVIGSGGGGSFLCTPPDLQ